jgi:hypothetical protein
LIELGETINGQSLKILIRTALEEVAGKIKNKQRRL